MSTRLSPRKLLFAAVGAATFAVGCSSEETGPVGNLVPPQPDASLSADAPAVVGTDGPSVDLADGPVANLMAPPDAPLS